MLRSIGYSICGSTPVWYLSWPLLNPTRLNFFIVQPGMSFHAASHSLSHWSLITGGPSSSLLDHAFSSGYLLFWASFSSTPSALLFTHSGFEPCQKASQIVAMLSGAGFTTNLGSKKTANSASPVPTMEPSPLHSFYYQHLFEMCGLWFPLFRPTLN